MPHVQVFRTCENGCEDHTLYIPYLRHFTYPLVKHMTLAAFNNDLKVCDAQ